MINQPENLKMIFGDKCKNCVKFSPNVETYELNDGVGETVEMIVIECAHEDVCDYLEGRFK